MDLVLQNPHALGGAKGDRQVIRGLDTDAHSQASLALFKMPNPDISQATADCLGPSLTI